MGFYSIQTWTQKATAHQELLQHKLQNVLMRNARLRYRLTRHLAASRRQIEEDSNQIAMIKKRMRLNDWTGENAKQRILR